MARPKHSELLVKTPDGWRPQRVHSVPPDIVSARFYCKNLTLREATAAAKAFNKAHLQKADFHGEWALCVKNLRSGPAPWKKAIDAPDQTEGGVE